MQRKHPGASSCGCTWARRPGRSREGPPRRGRSNRPRRGRKGLVTILAMMLVVLLSTLAVGMVYSTSSALQQSANLSAIQVANLQAEGGLSFMIHHLDNLSIEGADEPNEMLAAIATVLGERLNGSAALNQGQVLYNPNSTTPVSIPIVTTGGTGFFSAALSMPDPNTIHLAVTGTSGQVQRTVSVDFRIQPGEGGGGFLPCGINSRGPIRMTGNVWTYSTGDPLDASLMSATYNQTEAVRITGNVDVDGDVFVSNPEGEVNLTGNATIGGDSGQAAEDHIHIGIGPVEFPEVDTEAFRPLATNILTRRTNTGNKTFENLYIPAGLNPMFTGNVTINGVLFVEQPNKVRFTGNAVVNAIIVTEDAGENNTADNYIKFSGNVEYNHPADVLPDEPQFSEIRQMRGASILAPGFAVHMSGNFGTIAGWIAAEEFKFTGNVNGTLKGGIISYGDTELKTTGNVDLVFDRDENSNEPSGFILPSAPPKLVLQPGSYQEGN